MVGVRADMTQLRSSYLRPTVNLRCGMWLLLAGCSSENGELQDAPNTSSSPSVTSAETHTQASPSASTTGGTSSVTCFGVEGSVLVSELDAEQLEAACRAY